MGIMLIKAKPDPKSSDVDLRFYFDYPPHHEAGFVLLKTGSHMCLEVTSGLGSARLIGEFRICFVPSEENLRIQICRQAIAQFIRDIASSHGQLVANFDEKSAVWNGDLYPVSKGVSEFLCKRDFV